MPAQVTRNGRRHHTLVYARTARCKSPNCLALRECSLTLPALRFEITVHDKICNVPVEKFRDNEQKGKELFIFAKTYDKRLLRIDALIAQACHDVKTSLLPI
jgi:hypothetical protein